MGDVAKYECTKDLVMELNATEGIYIKENQHEYYMNVSRINYHMYVCISLSKFTKIEGKKNIVDHVKAICTNEGTWKMDAGFTCLNATVVDVVCIIEYLE